MRVLLVDDHDLFRAGLALLLAAHYPDIDVLHANTLSQGLDSLRREALNLVFLDLDLPDGHGCHALEEVKTSRPALPVIVISADERIETIQQCIELHAMGYVPKSSSPDALHAAIGAVLAGGVFLPASGIASIGHDAGAPGIVPTLGVGGSQETGATSRAADLGLTAREFETLTWIARGLPSKAIAVKMGLEDITVRKYVSQLLAHFNVSRRTELMVLLADRKIRLGAPPVSGPV